MITVNELFSGIGAFRKALERLKIPHEIIGISEIDRYAIQSYNAIYGDTRNYGDISEIYKLDYADLWTYGFPCQDISVAGKGEGIKRGETRSGLLYEVQRLLNIADVYDELPKYLIMENVKNLLGKQFRADFDMWVQWLDNLGYNSYYKILNAKDFGIPQSRERVFCVSIRKDIDEYGYSFPIGCGIGDIKLKDILEDDVAEKYYISNGWLENNINYEYKGKYNFKITSHEGVAGTLSCKADRRSGVWVLGKLCGGSWDTMFGQNRKVLSDEGICSTLQTCGGGGQHVKIKISEDTDRSARSNVRRLTPLEYWRLMGFDDEDLQKARDTGISDTQLYRQAGNSIVVQCLEGILTKLLQDKEDMTEEGQTSWMDYLKLKMDA